MEKLSYKLTYKDSIKVVRANSKKITVIGQVAKVRELVSEVSMYLTSLKDFFRQPSMNTLIAATKALSESEPTSLMLHIH